MGLVQYGGSDSEEDGADQALTTDNTGDNNTVDTPSTSLSKTVNGVRLLSTSKTAPTPHRSPSPPPRLQEQQPEAGPSRLPDPAPSSAARQWGLARFGIPEPAYSAPPDPALQAKLERFHRLSAQGHAFNASLMRNKAFRNPHILDKLVTFVNVDESGSHFGDAAWDREAMLRDGSASVLGERQKSAADQRSAAQSSTKRSNIDFAPATSTTTKPPVSSSKWDPSSSTSKRDRERDPERDHERRRHRSRSRSPGRKKERERDRSRY